jgi:nucleoside 2-deoxyribosyltransferase
LPIRTDRLNATGDIIEMIHSGINNCDCAIAVVTDLRPNVMYELGLAHAFQKPVLLLMKKNEEKKSLPFDIDNHSAIFYDRMDDELVDKISHTIQNVRETYLPGRFFAFRE